MVSEDVPHPHLGGLGKHALNLAHELNRRGHVVDFLGNGDNSIVKFPDQAGPGQFFGEISGCAKGWKERYIGAFTPWRTVLNARVLTRAIMARAARYDVVHYHGHLPWVADSIPLSVPFTQTRHDQGGDCMLKTRYRPDAGRCTFTAPGACAGCASPYPSAVQRQLSTFSVQHMRSRTARSYEQHPVIFVSRFLQDAFAKVSEIDFAGDVIHNAVDVRALDAALAAQARPDAAEVRFPVELFSAGAMLAYKGYSSLLAAMRRNPLPAGVRLTLAGAGPELNLLRQTYESAGVRFLGWTAYADVVRHVAAADAVIVPSEWDEPCATTVLEALALGRPVLAMQGGGMSELMCYSMYGIEGLQLFESFDTMVRAMSVHPPARRTAPASVPAAFEGSIEVMADKVLSHYAKRLKVRI